MTDVAFDWNLIIDALGGTRAVAGALAQVDSTVSGWRKRGIPSPHWAAVVRLAAERERPDISLEVLADLAAREVEEARA